ncbi:PAS domain S-box-containing protein [Rhizobacter sp. OV335]|nr:PAS domain S-box-containing protein [Rhizobacter sp. OV335]
MRVPLAVPLSSPLPLLPREPLDRLVARLFFGAGVTISLLGALIYLSPALPTRPGMRALLVGDCLVLALCFTLGLWGLRRIALPKLVHLMGWIAAIAVLVTAVGLGQGVHALNLGYLGLLICVVTVLVSPASGLVLALAMAAAVAGLAMANGRGWLPGPMPIEAIPLPVRVLAHWLIFASATTCGMLIASVVRRALGEARDREERFRSLLLMAADWYWELDAELRFTHISDKLNQYSGIDAKERMGRRPWEMPQIGLDADTLARHRADLEAHLPFSNLMASRPGEHGELRHSVVSGRPRFDADGRFVGYWGLGRDITAEVEARRATAESEGRYRELFRRSPTALVLHRNGVAIDGNDAAARMFGFASADAMKGFDLPQLYPAGEAREQVRRRVATLEALPVGEGLGVADSSLVSLDGRPLSVQASGIRVSAPDGPATLSMFHDITARVQAETALRRSQALLSHLVATSPDCITLTEVASGRYVMVNESFTRITGWRSDEVVGRTALEIGIWHRQADREALVAGLAQGGLVTDLPATFVRRDGTVVSLLLSAARFRMDDQDYLVLNGRDVTETERVRLQHEAILQNASIGIALTRERRFMQANPCFEAMFRWPAGALIGQPGQAVWSDEAAYAEMGALVGPRLAQGEPVEVERMMRRGDGSSFLCRLLAQAVDPTHPSQGGTIWIAEDVTERRAFEQALAHARDVAEAANQAKSAFLANTSHEIRTPLNGLLGLARLAMRPGLDALRRDQYLAQIQDSAQNLASIISDILDLSKIEAGKLSVEAVAFDLRGLLVAVHRAYQSLAQARGLSLRLAMTPEVPGTVLGDPVRVRQILSNYLTNGIKFTERGHVTLEATVDEDGRVRLAVIDTGAGIDEATQQRLFQPFTQADSSTTRRFGGTGLGLSICKELAMLMGGSVGVESAPERGSRFWAALPLPATPAREVGTDAESLDTASLAGAHVLMVEDNPVNMMIGVAMLEQWGVDVVQAVDGIEALVAVRRSVDAGRLFDAVLMDVQMPRLSGHEAARRLREQHPAEELPIIALTAAALVSERDQALAAGMNEFLTKPIDAHRLRQALLRAVAQSERRAT